jgi:mycobactin lysine-N-oxygenase
VGCGPKAVAIAARAQVLSELGWRVPTLVILERDRPAANWDGSNGYTDGRLQLLGTTPFEDVGFPYASILDPRANQAMLRFSFQAYLVDIGQFAEWIDRQLTPPTHGMVADYLRWVIAQLDMPVVSGEVSRARADGGRWVLDYLSADRQATVLADGLVVTGPGRAKQFPRTAIDGEGANRILDGQTFWRDPGRFADLNDARIAVIGGGETSAAIATYLAAAVGPSSEIEIVSRHPMLFTRNEHWMEVSYFSTAAGWSALTIREKQQVISHADRGTYSTVAKQVVDAAYNVRLRHGTAICIDDSGGRLTLLLATGHGDERVGYDYVVQATGFDPLSFRDWVDGVEGEDEDDFAERIAADLSLVDFVPRLHLPGLAAVAQGPGFPNLSCLGLLAERILAPYVESP